MYAWNLLALCSRNITYVSLIIRTILLLFVLYQHDILHIDRIELMEFTYLGSIESLLESTFYSALIFTTYVHEDEDDVTSPHAIKDSLDNIWNHAVAKIPFHSKIYITMKVKYEDENGDTVIKTLTPLLTVNVDDKDRVLDYFIGRIEIKGNEYQPLFPLALFISYAFDSSEGANTKIESYYGESDSPHLINKEKTNFIKVGNLDLPITTDLFKWGRIVGHEDNIVKIVKPHSNLIYLVERGGTFNYVKIMRGRSTILQFIDYLDSDREKDTTFKREIIGDTKKTLYIFEKGIRLFWQKDRGYQTIKTLKPAKNISLNFVTLDIETREVLETVDTRPLPYMFK